MEELSPPPQLPLASETDSIAQAILTLRRLLSLSKGERTANWEQLVSAEVAVLSANFSKQEDPAIALTQTALIYLAAARGNKDAKKRVLKPTRWLKCVPPSLSETLESIDEARAAILVLQPIKEGWVGAYIADELKRNRWPGIGVELISWLLKCTPNVAAFLKILNANTISGVDFAIWIDETVRTATKLLAKFSITAGVGLMTEAAELAERVVKCVGENPSEVNLRKVNNAQSTLIVFLAQVAGREPAILLDVSFMLALRRCRPRGKASRGGPSAELEALAMQTFSLLTAVLPNADAVAMRHYKAVLAGIRDCVPEAERLLKVYARDYPGLAELMSWQPTDSGEARYSSTGLEAVLSNLVSNWDEYFSSHSPDPALEQLASRIEDLLEHHNIVRVGHTGQIVPFDPLRHHVNTADAGTARVEILKPGLVVRRPDGTTRVLFMAIAQPQKNQ